MIHFSRVIQFWVIEAWIIYVSFLYSINIDVITYYRIHIVRIVIYYGSL